MYGAQIKTLKTMYGTQFKLSPLLGREKKIACITSLQVDRHPSVWFCNAFRDKNEPIWSRIRQSTPIPE